MIKIETIDKENKNEYFVVYNFNNGVHTVSGTPEQIIKELYRNMSCQECEGKGYLEDVVSEGLPAGDSYLEPHIERCDECKVFANDAQAFLAFRKDKYEAAV